jgi:excisionase family DNA binding protein
MQTEHDRKMTRDQAAEYLGVSASFLAVDAVTRRHAVPYIKVGRRVVYSKGMLDAWMAARVVNPPAGNAGRLGWGNCA